VRLGAVLTAVCASIGLIYVSATPAAPNRPWVALVGVIALLSAPLILTRPVLNLLTRPGRQRWLYVWSASLLVAVTTGVMLDGGARSPLTAMFGASLVFTALGYGRWGAAVMGVLGVGCYLLTCLVDSPADWTVVLTACSLAVMAATCMLTAGRLRASLEAQQRLTQQLREQAAHDGLTGCLNQRTFIERLDEEVSRARRSHRPLGFVMLDLDHFKKANDTYGHVAGDELLASLGAALRRSVRAGDIVGRIGGDEFGILAPDADEEATTLLAKRVQIELERVGTELAVGVSVGTSVLHELDDARELRHRADLVLYDAKRAAHRPARASSAK
jgi:diguanylate cyclase (GGDEF)-like protein